MFTLMRACCALTALAYASPSFAQSTTQLPAITVTAPQDPQESLTSKSAGQAIREIRQTPGGVAVIPAETYRNTRPRRRSM